MFEKKSPVDGVPVIPGGSFLTGHLMLLREPDFQVALHKWSVQHADEQGRVTFWMGPTTPCLSVTHPKDVNALLKATSHRELFPIMGRLMEAFFGKHNLATLTGKEWKSKRAIIVKALHGHQFVEKNRHAFKTAAETLVRRMETENSISDIQHVMKMLTLDAFGLAVLQTDFQCCRHLQPNSVAQDLEFLAQEMMRRMIVSPWDPSNYFCDLPTASNAKLRQTNQRIADFIADLIRKTKQDGNETKRDSGDLLSNLIQASEEQDAIEEEDVANIVKSLLFAGFETTSTTLTFVLHLLSQHPHIEERCAKEIQERYLVTSPATDTEATEVSMEFPYLSAVITETLRLFPPAISTTRSLDRNVELQTNDWARESDGIKINVPTGTYIYVPIWIVQRSSQNFSDPLSFRPERWLEGSSYAGKSTLPTSMDKKDAFVAFSAGGRSCAGEKFARQEMIIALSVLLRHYKFESLADYSTEIAVHREGFVISPKHPVAFKLYRR